MMTKTQQFEQLWRADSSEDRPDVFAFLSEHVDGSVDDVLAILQIDQQHRWQTDHPYKVEDYLERLSGTITNRKLRCYLSATILLSYLFRLALSPSAWSPEAKTEKAD